jgi:hypothetical protein
MKVIAVGVVTVLCFILVQVDVAARGPAQSTIVLPASTPDGKSEVPLRVQLTLSTYHGEKKISNVPYTLSVNAGPPQLNNRPWRMAQLRMGARIPVPALKSPAVDGKPIAEAVPGLPTGGGPVIYQNIGTDIDCWATVLDNGRFELHITIEDNAIVSDSGLQATIKKGEPPVIRSFRSSNQVVLRDGQSAQFTAATDRISGEVIRVDVTIALAK